MVTQPTWVAETGHGLPARTTLRQNYPNPFNVGTTIRCQLREAGYVTLEIYNVLGQRVRRLVSEEKPAGYHCVLWDGRDEGGCPVASEIYLCQLRVGDYRERKKVVVLR